MSVPTASSPLSPKHRDLSCFPWEGRPSEYQFVARDVLMNRLQAGPDLPWLYIVPTCETRRCLQELHLRIFRAQKIAYPSGVCVYCGMPAWTKDHLLPVTMTGEAVRKFVAVVPACGECNSAIGDRVGHRITERRAEAHEGIKRKHRKTLALGKRWSKAELDELGPKLRSHIEKSLEQREVQLARLAWPWDPEFDKRAFQKSGFDDPIAMDLL